LVCEAKSKTDIVDINIYWAEKELRV